MGAEQNRDAEQLVQRHGGVVTAKHAHIAGWSRGSIRAALDTGRLIRLRQGVYTSGRTWARASPPRRQRLLLLAHQRIDPDLIGWGLSAAAALGLPLPDDPLKGPFAKPDLRPRHTNETVLRLRTGVCLTTVDQIVIDCARRLPKEWGLAIADAAITSGLITQGDLQPVGKVAPVEGYNGPRGIRQARWVLDHARTGAESPLESVGRAVIVLGGFPEPAMQQMIPTRLGRYRVDLLDETSRLITEIDGKVKYAGPADVWQEKLREDALRDEGYAMIRFTMADYHRQGPYLERYRAAQERGRRFMR